MLTSRANVFNFKMQLIYTLFVILTLGLSNSCYAQSASQPAPVAEKTPVGDCKPTDKENEAPPEWKGSALHVAVIERDVAAVRKLLKQKADPNEKDNYGDAPLKTVAAMKISDPKPRPPDVVRREMEKDRKAQIEIFRLLLKSGADANLRGNYGLTPLMQINIYNYPADHAINLLSLLIENGADVNLQDEEGYTALMLAAKNGNSKVVDFLLEKGSDAKALNCEKKTALDYARDSKNTETIKILENLK